MKKTTLCIAAIAASCAICSSMLCSTTVIASPMHSTILVSAAESTTGNLIVHVSGLATLSGVKITVTGNAKTYDAVTNSNGQAVFEKLPVQDASGNTITYTIKETIPNGYMAASAMTTTLSAGSTIIASFPNTEKSYTIAIDAVDYKTGSINPSGDAVLSGGSYTVYHNDVAYGTYFIAADGKLCEFTLHDKEYAGKWTVQMNEAPLGYYLDPIAADLDEITASFPQYMHATMHLNLLPISGKFAVEAQAGDNITVYLQSAGSYDNSRATERAKLTFSDDQTKIDTDILPYGTYVIENETSGMKTTAKIENYGAIVPVSLKNASTTITTDVTEPSSAATSETVATTTSSNVISVYRLYDHSDTLVCSGSCSTDGKVVLPDNIAPGRYYLEIEQGSTNPNVGSAVSYCDIIVNADGTYTEYTPDNTFYGDVNLDGIVDLTDAILLQKSVSGMVTLNAQAQKNADCNSDAAFDAGDGVSLMRFLVHLIPELPEL